APHPSPLSAYRGFFGSKAFSQTNAYLDAHGVAAINWDLPNISDAIAEYEAAKETIHALFLSPSV
ncbi:MAG: hypothetical protein KAG19_01265, partial [Methylococcales bacterium]|nr:hypothetical protein [Methylococcales bacterium]